MDPAAALQVAGPRAALSHESAARSWGLELLEPGQERLTVPRSRSRLLVPGWQVVRSDLAADDVEERGGLITTGLLRTICDLCRVLPLTQAVVAADSALRQELVAVRELSSRLRAAQGPGARRVRLVDASVDPLSGSVLETVLRLVLQVLTPAPLSQHEIRDRFGELVARVDFCWPSQRLIVEADGFAFHSDRSAYRRDRERLNELERLGWRVLRFTWEDVMNRPDHVRELVRECLASRAA